MAARTTTQLVQCPQQVCRGRCGGMAVEAIHANTVMVQPCDYSHQEDGLPQAVLLHSEALELLVPA